MRKLSIQSTWGTIRFPKIILGSVQFGTGIEEKKAFSLMNAYADMGGTCIDTASVYGDWEDKGEPISERTIGKWLKESGYRHKMMVITKGAHYRLKTPRVSRVSAVCIAEDIEKSLRNLQVDAIDLYFLHRDNPSVPVGELMPVLHKYVAAGKIKAIGASNWSIERIREANMFAVANRLTPFAVSEIQWSLARFAPGYRAPEELPGMTETEYEKYRAINIPVFAWSSQAGGVVTRVIENGTDGIDAATRTKYIGEKTLRRIENVKRFCAKTGLTPTQAVLSYITCNPLPAAAVIGPSSLEHLRDSMAAADLDLGGDIVCSLTD